MYQVLLFKFRRHLCKGSMRPKSVHSIRFDSLWAHSTVSVSGFAAGRPNLDPYMTYLSKLTATFERCEIRWRRFTCLLRPVRTCLSFWGKVSYLSNSTNGKKWNLKKLKTKETPFNIENCVWKSIERVALSFIVELHTASFTISDTRRWIVLFFGLCNTLLWLWTTYIEQHALMTLNNLWEQK